MMSVLPLLAASGMAFGALLGKLSSKSSEAYGRANSIVQQVCAGTSGSCQHLNTCCMQWAASGQAGCRWPKAACRWPKEVLVE
jgi:hypothetical protein